MTTTHLTEAEHEILQRADAWLAEHRQEYIDDLLDWVSYPSVARPDQAAPGTPFGPEVQRVFDRAVARAGELGFASETHEGYAVSVLGGNTDADEEIGLVAHLDVVPAGTGWLSDAFAPYERDGFVVGRGSGDDKSPAVGDLYLLRILRDLDIPLRHRVRVLYGGAEELGMLDLEPYVERGLGPIPRLSLVTDASFPVNYAQKGGLDLELFIPAGPVVGDLRAGVADNAVPSEAELLVPDADAAAISARLSEVGIDRQEITVTAAEGGALVHATGRSGHAAHPEGTRNAILVLASALADARLVDGADLTAAKAIAQILSTPYGDGSGIAYEDEESGRLTQNGGIVEPTEGGLLLHLDIRYSVTADPDELLAALGRTIAEFGGRVHSSRVSKRVYLPKDSDEVQLLQGALADVLGRTAEPYAMGGGTHSRVLPGAITFGAGFRDTPELLPDDVRERQPDFLGDGPKGAHGANEYVDIDEIFLAVRIYLIALLRLDAYLTEE